MTFNWTIEDHSVSKEAVIKSGFPQDFLLVFSMQRKSTPFWNIKAGIIQWPSNYAFILYAISCRHLIFFPVFITLPKFRHHSNHRYTHVRQPHPHPHIQRVFDKFFPGSNLRLLQKWGYWVKSNYQIFRLEAHSWNLSTTKSKPGVLFDKVQYFIMQRWLCHTHGGSACPNILEWLSKIRWGGGILHTCS